MENQVDRYSDGINLYLRFRVRSAPSVKVFLTFVVGVLFIFYIYILSTVDNFQNTPGILPFAIVGLVGLFFSIKYTLWNFFGQEYLIINTKSISYNYSFGFFTYNLRTVLFERLGTGFEFVSEYNGIKKGKLIFYRYRAKDDLPETIHETSILINLEEISIIDEEIAQLFFDKNFFFAFSSN